MPLFVAIAYAAEAVNQSGSGGIGALGINGTGFLFQVINFVVLLIILRLVAYKPILKMLDERQQKIAASLKSAEAIEAAKIDIARQRQEILDETYQKAEKILDESRAEAANMVHEAEKRAKARGEQLVLEAQNQIRAEVTKARQQLKQETLGLVARATERVVAKKLDPKTDEALIEQALNQAFAETKKSAV